jgi:hypothetical protein
MDVKTLINTENNSNGEMEENNSSNIEISNRIFAGLTSIGFLSSIMGFIITLPILVDLSQDSILTYPHGLLIGILLLSGGVIIILGAIILKKEYKNNSNTSPLNKDINNQIN